MTLQWQPSASLQILKKRQVIINKIRHFFSERNYLEVETPLVTLASGTDPHIDSIIVNLKNLQLNPLRGYLQTSPEFAMKRLLAAGSGSIFQICKAFRQGDIGRLHNPEFTLLEWYQVHCDHHQLMDEVDELLRLILLTEKAERVSFASLFANYLNVDPFQCTIKDLSECANLNKIKLSTSSLPDDIDTWVNLLFTHSIEPKLGIERPLFVFDFPPYLAAMAKIRHEIIPVASRFEVYWQGIELANGFHELQSASEQECRFNRDLQWRQRHNLDNIPIDKNFLAALQHGLPDCAGVALGIDRLVMLALAKKNLTEVISFSFDRI